jgi:hypothetical protein
VYPHAPTVHEVTVFAALALGHAPPHTLQLCGSVIRFTSHPSATIPLQFANPELHVVIEQAPAAHALTAFGTMHE